MKKLTKIFALTMGAAMSLSLFAACGGKTDDHTHTFSPDWTTSETEHWHTATCGHDVTSEKGKHTDTNPSDGKCDVCGYPMTTTPTPTTKTGIASAVTISYDNLDDDFALPASVTTFTAEKGLDTSKFTVIGRASASYTGIVTYDGETGVFTAKSAGSVVYETAEGDRKRIDVVPAYVEDPETQYGSGQDLNEEKSTLLGHTHDPSFVEVVKTNGKSEYYLFSTGWADQSNIDGERTYGNAIHYSEDLLHWEFMGRTFDVETRDEDFVDTKAGDWLYDGITSGYDSDDASWWAPDIVPCPTGGYWLYTCVVDGAGDNQGMQLPGGNYARACILLYWSKNLNAGSFKPVKDSNGDPVVLMQSSIRRGESEADVNGIDPQIIYTPEGKMYMAYGSFGSGDYILELDPATGLRKDGVGWKTQDEIRQYVADIQSDWGSVGSDSVGWTHTYYGKNISKSNMEAPVIARHDNVVIMDENEQLLEGSGKTYYYSMHSYDGLGDNYQMWGGRSESVTGVYNSVMGGIVRNVGPGNNANSGNKYMGAFSWKTKSATSKEYDIILPGHNDLYTTTAGVNLAAYITRLPGNTASDTGNFVTQVHQYYLNSLGHIVINPNRYAGEIDRAVSEEELLHFTEMTQGKGYRFQMVVMLNQRDTQKDDFRKIMNVSRDVYLKDDHTITEADGTALGTWKMYGAGYIKFTFTSTLKGTNNVDSGEKVYYGVVRPAWLGDQNKSGFTITCLGATEGRTQSLAMFMNNYSTITGEGLVG